MSPLIALTYLLVTGSRRDGGRGRVKRVTSSRGDGEGRGGNRGRARGRNRPSTSNAGDSNHDELHPLPQLTMHNAPRPSYYTCRHGYERTLMDEIQRRAPRNSGEEVTTSSPYPGLVRVENSLFDLYDPVYALQYMPSCHVVQAESIKGIAREVTLAITELRDQGQQLRMAKRGSLVIHTLVPGMCKGQKNPVMKHRSEKIGEELSKMLSKSFPAARKVATDDDGNQIQPSERWLLQMMLQSPT